MPGLPLPEGLDVRGRRVVVVGGDPAVRRPLTELVEAGADVLLVGPVLAPPVRELVGELVGTGAVSWHGRRFRAADLDTAWLALTCTDDDVLAAEVAAEAIARRMFCLTEEPDATTTHSPRQTAPSRTAVSGTAVNGTAVNGTAVNGTAARDTPLPGVALVGGGPGDPDLITVRGRRLLERADVVIADRLGPRELLDRLDPRTEIIDASKVPYGRAMAQDRIHQLMIAHARAGRFVVRLKGGDPFVFGRGYEEVIACTEAGLPVTVVPGVTSAFAVPASGGVPVSHRGVAHEIVVVSGHFGPDDPRSLVDWPSLGRLRGTLVLMMAVERIELFAAALIEHGRPPDTPVTVVQDGTTRVQRTLAATLETVAARVREHRVSPPSVIVVGPVAGLTPSTRSWVGAGAGRYGVPELPPTGPVAPAEDPVGLAEHPVGRAEDPVGRGSTRTVDR